MEQQVEQARAKVRALVALEQKLADSITTKRHGLLASEIDSGKEFRNDDAGVRLTCGSFPPHTLSSLFALCHLCSNCAMHVCNCDASALPQWMQQLCVHSSQVHTEPGLCPCVCESRD